MTNLSDEQSGGLKITTNRYMSVGNGEERNKE